MTQSCAKNLGLYGERTGAFHMVTASKVRYVFIILIQCVNKQFFRKKQIV